MVGSVVYKVLGACVLQDVHQAGVQSLTDWTAVCIQLYYGIAQSMLLDQPCDVSLYAQKADSLARSLDA